MKEIKLRSVFLDTNIVLDLLDSQREKHKQVKLLLAQLADKELQTTVSEDMLSTIYYIIKNKQAVLEFFKFINKEWDIVPFGKDTINLAIEQCLSNEGQDFEDTLQCLCAKNSGCDLLISRDKSFIDCGIAVMDPSEFLVSSFPRP